MLINLLPDFFAVLDSTDRVAAYQRYFAAHRTLLEPYWHNYVVDPDGPHFRGRRARDRARRSRGSARRCSSAPMSSRSRATPSSSARSCSSRMCDVDVVLMVGVGAANAGELVVDGRGIAFVCLEHFTGVANPETEGLGLDPELHSALARARDRARRSLHVAHEPQRVARRSSPKPAATTRTGTRAGARRCASCSINEGLAVHVSRRSARDTPRGSTSATGAASTRAFASSSPSSRAPSPGPRSRRAGPSAALSLRRHERRSAHGRSLRASRARRLLPRRAHGARPAIAAARPRVGGARQRRRDRAQLGARRGDDGVTRAEPRAFAERSTSRRRTAGTLRRARRRRRTDADQSSSASAAARRCTPRRSPAASPSRHAVAKRAQLVERARDGVPMPRLREHRRVERRLAVRRAISARSISVEQSPSPLPVSALTRHVARRGRLASLGDRRPWCSDDRPSARRERSSHGRRRRRATRRSSCRRTRARPRPAPT